MTARPSKPLLKWPGGKARLAPVVADAFGSERPTGYHEPFAGGAAVYWHLLERGLLDDLVEPAQLTDTCGSLIVAYRAVRDDPAFVRQVLDELGRHHLEPRAWTDDYYAVRRLFNGYRRAVLPPLPEAAFRETPTNTTARRHGAQMLWLNRACFNGLWRTNRRGDFNAAKGSYQHVRVPDLAPWAAALAGVRLSWCDWRWTVRAAKRGAWLFADPPYLPLDDQAGTFTSYSSSVTWDETEHEELALALVAAARRGVLTNHDCERTHTIYSHARGFRRHASVDLSRSISQSKDRMVAREVVLTPDPADANPVVHRPFQPSLLGATP